MKISSKIKILFFLWSLLISVYPSYGQPSSTDSLYIQKSDSIVDDIILRELLKTMMVDYIHEEDGILKERTVDRGESWAILAARCGMEEWEIQALNADWDFLPVGSEILIAQFKPGTERYEAAVIASDIRYNVVNDYIDKEDWKKAKKLCKSIIDDSPSLTAYYTRGIINYNYKKFGDAIDDFQYVIDNDYNKLYPKAKDNLSLSQEAWERQKAENAEMWMNIIGLAVETTALIADSYNTSNNKTFSSSTYAKNTYVGPIAQQMSQPGYFESVNAQLMQQSITQVENQIQMEYQQMRSAYLRLGKDLSFNEFYALRGQAIANMNSENSFDSNSSFDTMSSSSSTDTPSYTRKCAYCDGTGRIVKEWTVATFGTQDVRVKCGECGFVHFKSTGHTHVNCSHCRGGVPK